MTTTTPEPADPSPAPERRAGRANLRQLIQLRWLAVLGQGVTILVVDRMLSITLPLAVMLGLTLLLAGFNLVSAWRARTAPSISNLELCVGLLLDVAVLTAQLYFSGGTDNPFIYLYLLQVVVGALLLRLRYLLVVVAATLLGFVFLADWHRPLSLDPERLWSLPPEYLGGVLLCFVLNVSLLVLFMGRITRNLRQRDAELAELKQQAAEQTHIVRMGLLASGAAHELGTPLATLDVILGDWAHMAPFAAEPELREEIEEMQQQIRRCKAIVSGILMSAGEVRGEGAGLTPLRAFLGRVAERWRAAQPGVVVTLDHAALPEVAIVSDRALEQVLVNLLENAREAAPESALTLRAWCDAGPEAQEGAELDADEQILHLQVLDRGPGFDADTLARFGNPYQSSKGQPGRGLGLFLSVNVARSLGGRLEARNREGGGAAVTLSLPLASLLPRKSV